MTTKWLLRSTYPVVLYSTCIRTVDYVDKGKGLCQIFEGNVRDLLRIANARTVYNDHTLLQENKRLHQECAKRFKTTVTTLNTKLKVKSHQLSFSS